MATRRRPGGVLELWFVPILIIGAITFALEILGFVAGIGRSGVVSRGLARLVVFALIVMATARLVLLVAVQLYIQGAAVLITMWPLAQ